MTKRALVLVLALFTAGAAWFFWPRPRLAKLMHDGVTAMDQRRFDRARQSFDAVLSREPDHARALLLRGQLERELGQFDRAHEFWNRVPDAPVEAGAKARFLEGAMLIETGAARRGEQLLRRAAQLHPASRQARDLLIRLYVLQQRREDCRRELRELRKSRHWSLDELILYSTDEEQIEDPAASMDKLQKFIAADPEDSHSPFALARCLDALDRRGEAIDFLRQVLLKHPQFTLCSGLLAEWLVQDSELTAAYEVLQNAPVGTAVEGPLWCSHGMYAAAVHDLRRASLCLQQAAALNPRDLSSVYKLGLVLAALGTQAESEAQLGRAKRFEQVSMKIHLLAHERHRPAAELAPVAVEIARLLSENGQNYDALAWLDQALQCGAESPSAIALRRDLLERVAAAGSAPRSSVPPSTKELGPIRPPADHAKPDGALASSRPSSSSIVLRDCHEQAGLTFEYFNGQSGSKYLLETLGGGVAVLDFDGDDWPDLYFTQGASIPPEDGRVYRDRLFRNLGNGTFLDVTDLAGLGDVHFSQGCAAGDIDNDGDPDLIVANWGQNALYLNNGDGTFVEAASSAGLSGQHWSTSLALADFDRDGNLDLYVVNYVLDPLRTCRAPDGRIATCHPANYEAEPDVLYRNLGDGTFRDVSEAAGILVPDGKGLGIVVSDLDQDGWPDIYVANDGTANFLFRNVAGAGGGLWFIEQALASGAALSGEGLAQGSMGIAAGDLNGDGRIDLYVTNFYSEGSALYENHGDMIFTDEVRSANLYAPTHLVLGFGTQAVDFDLDGRLDLFATNGHIDDFRYRGEPWKMRPQLFRNTGAARFSDVSSSAGELFEDTCLGRGVARLDWDRDGKPDLIVTHLDRPAALLRNETLLPGHSLIIELHGVESNRDAIGARIKVVAGGITQVHQVCGGDGYFASNERRLIVGLGEANRADSVEVVWPKGRIERREAVAAGLLRLVEGHSARYTTK